MRPFAALTIAVWVLVVVTGLYVAFDRPPTAAAAYEDIASLRSDVTFGLWMKRTHVWASVAALILLVAGLVLGLTERWGRKLVVATSGLLATALAGAVVALVLPWNQFRLSAVTAGTNLMGFQPVFGDDINFVPISGSSMSLTTMVRLYSLHVFWLPLLGLACAVAVAVFVQRPQATAPPTSAPVTPSPSASMTSSSSEPPST